MWRLLTLILAFFPAACAAELSTTTPSPSRWADDTRPAWSGMQRALTGRWEATTRDSRTIMTSYRAVSNGSALVETFTGSSGKETLSVYHHDGPALMLTHYCAQGNQVRLKATVATSEKVTFTFLDATNVDGEQSVMRQLTFVLRPDGFDQESIYQSPRGELEATTLHFVRAAKPSP